MAPINRYGTFLDSENPEAAHLLSRLHQLLQDQLKAGGGTAERREILEQIQKSLTGKAYSSNIREEGTQLQFSLSSQEVEWMNHKPDARWVDYLVYRYQFKLYPRQQKLTDFPLYVLIEPTSVCNLRCVMCFQVDKSFTKKEYMGHMPWELFTKVADQLKDRSPAVTLASRGEPTLHPKFPDMLKYLADLKIMDLKINTNATRLTEKISHAILEAGVNEVVFSVDAGTEKTYEEIRVGGKFTEVVANIEQFHKIRETKYHGSPCITRISGVQVRDDQDIQQMSKFWNERVDQVTIKRATPRWDSYNNEPIPVAYPCGMLWERLYVWYDGKVNPCDFDYKSYLCVGDANTTSLKEIWAGETYQKLRREHQANQRNKINPCDRCPVY